MSGNSDQGRREPCESGVGGKTIGRPAKSRISWGQVRRDGYLEGNGYQVTWAFGHLVTLKEPDEYDPALKKWSLEPLPFIPEPFELKLVPEKHARQQFAVVKQLFRAATKSSVPRMPDAKGN